MAIVQITELQCMQCGHQWTPRKPVVARCPKCQSASWDIPRRQIKDYPTKETADAKT